MKMIDRPSAGPAVMENVGDSGEFHIRNSAKAFSILSDGLYSNKIKAIIRELSTNALDSHVEADRSDVPIEVHLPTDFEPWFSVKDTGIGLDKQGVMELYTTYFQSTKTNSDDFVGALGLGSKSPFAYTDNFTVTAVHHGRKGIYTAYISENGVPSITQMTETDTDEHNGVEVRLAVKSSDTHHFLTEAKNLYAYFDMSRVRVLGVKDFEPRTVEYSMENIIPNVHVRSRSGGPLGNHNVIMGCIAYPVNLGDLSEHFPSESTAALAAQRTGLDIVAPIGAVSIQPSREGLSYDQSTCEYIIQVFQEVLDKVVNDVAKSLDPITNIWEFKEVANRLSQLGSLFNLAVDNYTDKRIQSQGFPRNFVTPRWDRTSSLRQYITMDVSQISRDYNIKISGFSRGFGITGMANRKPNYRNAWEFEVNDFTTFVIEDTSASVKRSKEHFKNRGEIYPTFVLRPYEKSRGKPLYSRFLREVLMEPMNVYYSSELDKPVKQHRHRKKPSQGVMVLKDGDIWRDIGDYPDSEISQTLGKKNDVRVYVDLNHSTVQNPGFAIIDRAELMRIASYVMGNLNAGRHLIGLRKSAQDFVKDRPNWIRLEEAALRVVKAVPDTYYLRSSSLIDTFRIFCEIHDNTSLEHKSDLTKVVNKYQDHLPRVDNNHVMCVYYLKRSGALESSYDDRFQKAKKQFDEDVNMLTELYPMLKYVSKHGNNRNNFFDDITDYIKMMDDQNKQGEK